MDKPYRDIYYQSFDGLTLYARDYPADDHKPVLLCLHGLTRNSSDFEGFAKHFANDYRLIIPDQRGRGNSNYDPTPANYQLTTYLQDMLTLLDHLNISSVKLVGTSMGGLMSILLGATQPNRIKTIVLNDIGPEIDPAGLARIQEYVGNSPSFDRWDDAIAQMKTNNRGAFPGFSEQQWIEFTHRNYQQKNGKIITRYDHAIAEPMKQPGALPDLWPLYEQLSGIPVLIIRGDRSDILAADTATEMTHRIPNAMAVNILNRGHAPLLDEPVAIKALNDFFSRFA